MYTIHNIYIYIHIYIYIRIYIYIHMYIHNYPNVLTNGSLVSLWPVFCRVHLPLKPEWSSRVVPLPEARDAEPTARSSNDEWFSFGRLGIQVSSDPERLKWQQQIWNTTDPLENLVGFSDPKQQKEHWKKVWVLQCFPLIEGVFSWFGPRLDLLDNFWTRRSESSMIDPTSVFMARSSSCFKGDGTSHTTMFLKIEVLAEFWWGGFTWRYGTVISCNQLFHPWA